MYNKTAFFMTLLVFMNIECMLHLPKTKVVFELWAHHTLAEIADDNNQSHTDYPSLKCFFGSVPLASRSENVWLISALDMQEIDPLQADFDRIDDEYTKNEYILINKNQKCIYLPYWNIATRGRNSDVIIKELFAVSLAYIKQLKTNQKTIGINCRKHGMIDLREIMNEKKDILDLLYKNKFPVEIFFNSFSSGTVSLAINCHRIIHMNYGKEIDQALIIYDQFCKKYNHAERPGIFHHFWKKVEPTFISQRITKSHQINGFDTIIQEKLDEIQEEFQLRLVDAPHQWFRTSTSILSAVSFLALGSFLCLSPFFVNGYLAKIGLYK